MVNYLDEIAKFVRETVPEEFLPEDDPTDLFRAYAVLALSLGGAVTAEHVHHAWVAWMSDRDPTHPSLVPFEELDNETSAADEPFAEAIREVAAKISK